MPRRNLPVTALLIAILCPLAVSADESGKKHVRLLRDAYREFSEPLATGEMKVAVSHPHHGLTHEIHAVWDDDEEFVEIRDYGTPESEAASARRPLTSLPARTVTTVVGPEGTLVRHTPLNGTPVVHLSRGVRKKLLDGSARIIPEPHVAWYQQTWGGQSLWLNVLNALADGSLPAAVTAEELGSGDVRLHITNEQNGYQWQLTYSELMGGRIINCGPEGAKPASVYVWEQDAEELWFLREYRNWTVRSTGGDHTEQAPFVIRVKEFSYKPQISRDRFLFRSVDLTDGTVMLESSDDSGHIQSRVLGQNKRTTVPTLSDYRRIAEQLQQQGFARPNHVP